MKALKYNTLGKVKYDFYALIISLLILLLGVVLGIAISAWCFLVCFLSIFIAALYQMQLLVDFRDTEIVLTEDRIEFLYSNGETDTIGYHELKSIEVDVKGDFAQQFSFPIKMKTQSKEYPFLLCGANQELVLNQLVFSLKDKTSFHLIDKKNFFCKA